MRNGPETAAWVALNCWVHPLLKVVAHRPWPLPAGPWVMRQTWHDLLFAHWPLPPALMRPLVPAPLMIDTFDGQSWAGVIPFHMSRIRGRGLPPLPGLSRFPELNVRTYVSHGGKAGVYFFSLDAVILRRSGPPASSFTCLICSRRCLRKKSPGIFVTLLAVRVAPRSFGGNTVPIRKCACVKEGPLNTGSLNAIAFTPLTTVGSIVERFIIRRGRYRMRMPSSRPIPSPRLPGFRCPRPRRCCSLPAGWKF
jgi:uncharacterized protein YqjF (DUF2071 family)